MKIIDAFWNFFLFKYYNVIIGKNFRCDGRMIIQGRGEVLYRK